MSALLKIKGRLTSFQIIILGFISVIFVGTILLMLPISSQSGQVTNFGDSLFTATSAVCVTGLVVYDTASYWSYFGQAVILILIQIGGLGVVTIASFMAMLTGKKINLLQRQTMQNALAAPQMGGVVRLTRFILIAVVIIEIIGALLLFPVFIPKYGAQGIWLSIFHSISAFCNAGFDLMGSRTGEFSSLTSFSGNIYMTLVICALIIIGGIGFLTLSDIVHKRHKLSSYRMQSKVILVTTVVLIAVPAVIMFFSCFTEGSISERISMSLFQAVTPRTAGFNTANIAAMPDVGLIMIMVLMLIGGSPGSTAGGIKTTTVATLFGNVVSVFRKRPNVNFFGRRLSDIVVKNASAILMMYCFLAVGGAFIISLVENIPMSSCLFETFSAIGTVGLSLGITPDLSIISQLVLVILMFWGRVGGFTIIYAAFSQQDLTASKYPTESIMIG
ncbi:MAG: Trk family potassium uptake protein [Lachnospiraceae bacterium]|nr:Trk family potassium uptake protein [Lachnospiraceae bacterium]